MGIRSKSGQVSRARSGWRRVADYLLTIIVLVALIFVAARLMDQGAVEQGGDIQGCPIINDGDSLTFGNVRVRLWGIDAPEFQQVCGHPDKPIQCGRNSRRALGNMIDGQTVVCTRQGDDRYGRVLGICSVGSVNLNQRMVATGQAVSYGGYKAEEQASRNASLGLWADEFERPTSWRKTHHGETDATHEKPAPVAVGLQGWIDWVLKKFFG